MLGGCPKEERRDVGAGAWCVDCAHAKNVLSEHVIQVVHPRFQIMTKSKQRYVWDTSTIVELKACGVINRLISPRTAEVNG